MTKQKRTYTPAQRKKRYDTVLMTIIAAFICPMLILAVSYLFSANNRLIKVETGQKTIIANQADCKAKDAIHDTELVILKVKLATLESDKKARWKHE